MRRTRWLALALALAAATVAGSVGTAAATTGTTAGAIAGDTPAKETGAHTTANPAVARKTVKTVTLVTGDKVELATYAGGRQGADFEPGPGRAGIGYVERRTDGDHLSVLPADALPLVAAGRLDARLFDVTALTEQGFYDEADGPAGNGIPLILTYTANPTLRASARRDLSAAGTKVTRELASIRGQAVRTPTAAAGRFWTEITAGAADARTLDPGVAKVWLDGRVRASLDQSVPQVGAPTAWAAGYTGKGVKVAVLDTGIDAHHPDLTDAVAAAKDFTDTGSTQDGDGHGTHVASTITGSGAASGGRYKGVAPDAELLVGKVLDDGGFGQDSWIIAGMEWASAQGADVVNMSLGKDNTPEVDPVEAALDALTKENGTLFVVAAGNSGPGAATIGSPGSAAAALTVGAVDRSDHMAEFSSRGPSLDGSGLKPEITAPGVDIVAARAEGTNPGPIVEEQYTVMSGTSMAAPHVTGGAAILVQQHPDWTVEELRSALVASAAPTPGLSVFEQGAGRLDLARAIDQHVLAEPATLSLGLADWPHTDDQLISRTVTYRNTDQTAVTLDLAVTATGSDGEPAPAGMFTVTPARLVVPAGGTAEATVVTDTSVPAADGSFSGALTATAGGSQVSRTPIGIVREVESYDLTVDALDRDGQPAETVVLLTDVATGVIRDLPLPGGSSTLRLPKGRYDLATSSFSTPDPGERGTATLMTHPDLPLDRNTSVTLDARKALPVRAVVDSKKAVPQGRQSIWVANDHSGYQVWGGDDPNRGGGDLYVTPTPKVRTYPFTFGLLAALTEPEPAKGSRDVPRGYNLHETKRGQVPSPPVFRVHDRDLAAITGTYHSQGVAGARTARLASIVTAPNEGGTQDIGYDVRVPGRRIDYYSAGPDLSWTRSLATDDGGEDNGRGREYVAGRTYVENWNRAAIGPIAIPFSYGGTLFPSLALFSPGESRHTFSPAWDATGLTTTTSLSRNGQPLGSNEELSGGTFEIPSEPGTYTLKTRATRTVPWSTLATRVHASWTFSGGPFEDFEGPGLLGVRIDGDFDQRDRAPARAFPLRVGVERTDGVQPTGTTLTLQASFDDGRTWRALTVTRKGAGFRAVVPKAPAGAAFVSLRANASDADGNRVRQTVIRAYEILR